MKLFLLLAILYSNVLYSQSSIYDLTITTSSGKSINLSEYKGRKIIIACVIPTSLQKEGILTYWDSLQVANPKVVLILMPGTDSDSAAIVLKNMPGNIILSAGAKIKKDKGDNQNPIAQWLTHSGKNYHFNANIETDSQLYFISESGVLYAVLETGVRKQVINDVLSQAEVKQQAIISPEMQH